MEYIKIITIQLIFHEYQISNDFSNIDQDLKNNDDGVTLNYVINCGIQESYEKFMDSKQKFIEEAMNLEIFS